MPWTETEKRVRAATEVSHTWSLLTDEGEEEGSANLDEHEQFVRSVRQFQCTLMRHSIPDGEDDDEVLTWNPGNSPYISRFAQPCPVRPIWAALPRPRVSEDGSFGQGMEGPGGEPWASDFSCAPLVCVVFQDKFGLKQVVRQALCKLATHPSGLIINVKAIAVHEDGKAHSSSQQPLDATMLFAMIGLAPPYPGGDDSGDGRDCPSPCGGDGSPASVTTAGYLAMENRRVLSKADQRQVVWAAIHEALGNEEQVLPDIVVDIYMLQDVYLYDRLFKWQTVTKRSCGCGTLKALSREELDLLAHEYGEETATHFLFVARYIKQLRVAAAVSALCVILTLADRQNLFGRAFPKLNSLVRIIFVTFLPIWAFHFLASWKSAASRAGFRWLGSLAPVQNSVKEIARLQAMESRAEKRARYFRVMVMSVPLMVAQMLVVLLTTVTFVTCEVYIYDVIWDALSKQARLIAFILYNTAFGIAFILMLGVFHPISKAVTKCERHPDKETAEWHLITKIYANWFLAVFLYFFVIAFCYIPFGDNIADFIANTFPMDPAGEQGHSIRHALQAFRPEIHRLAFDVTLFFLMQDSARLMQVLIPVMRAAWGFGHLRGLRQRHKQKRTAIFWGALTMCRPRCCASRRSRTHEFLEEERTKDSTTSSTFPTPPSTDRTTTPEKRTRAMTLVPTFLPDRPKASSWTADERGVAVVYIHLESVSIFNDVNPETPPPSSRSNGAQSSFVASAQEAAEVVLLACRLENIHGGDPFGLGAAAGGGGGGGGEGSTCTSRLRVCYGGPRNAQFHEDRIDSMSDLLTLSCSPDIIEQGGGTLSLSAEVLHASSNSEWMSISIGDSTPTSWNRAQRIPFGLDQAVQGMARTGAVQVRYTIGVVHAPTHPEALEKVPRALRRARSELPIEPPEEELQQPDAHIEEALHLPSDGRMPWLWWDEELTESFWDEVFELYTVKENFETFEIYGHLATQFSYVCLFGIAVPACPLLAWIFTAVEARQDQMRLLWLSRPPQPHEETRRFKRTISLSAWYTIFRFTAHMSVIVNLLLWAITFKGLDDPAEWSSSEWWRAIATFLLLQNTYFFLGDMVHSNISTLDHETATAYLLRCKKLRQALREEQSKRHSTHGFSRQAARESSRKRLTRTGSKGLSGII